MIQLPHGIASSAPCGVASEPGAPSAAANENPAHMSGDVQSLHCFFRITGTMSAVCLSTLVNEFPPVARGVASGTGFPGPEDYAGIEWLLQLAPNYLVSFNAIPRPVGEALVRVAGAWR